MLPPGIRYAGGFREPVEGFPWVTPAGMLRLPLRPDFPQHMCPVGTDHQYLSVLPPLTRSKPYLLYGQNLPSVWCAA